MHSYYAIKAYKNKQYSDFCPFIETPQLQTIPFYFSLLQKEKKENLDFDILSNYFLHSIFPLTDKKVVDSRVELNRWEEKYTGRDYRTKKFESKNI